MKEFSSGAKQKIEEILKSFPARDAALLPVLHLAQDEFGYISPEAIRCVADTLGLPYARVASVVTFYTLYRQKRVGRHHVQVCTNISCALSGAEGLLEYLKERLKINPGETSPDGKWSLSTVECLGSCGTAPVMQVNETYYENLTREKIEAILKELGKR
ncbi:MAG: NAD(P)H-dependent oxidoreductase subunit E [Deltaproteobacteria bacterium]|nr:NAD(P)H-dependent oxidoreductase subunit E [Deltaproteobacteria bacterium]